MSYPDPKLTPAERRRLDRALDQRNRILRVLQGDPKAEPPVPGLTEGVLAELLRRAREPARDAWVGGGEGARSNGVSCPVEAVVVRDEEWDAPDDQVLAAIEVVFSLLGFVDKAVQRLGRRKNFAFAVGDSARGRRTLVGSCEGCGTTVTGAPDDRLRSGYCPPCYQAWLRYLKGNEQPDRADFERKRKLHVATQKGQVVDVA